jgi:hypothetical protein
MIDANRRCANNATTTKAQDANERLPTTQREMNAKRGSIAQSSMLA